MHAAALALFAVLSTEPAGVPQHDAQEVDDSGEDGDAAAQQGLLEVLGDGGALSDVLGGGAMESIDGLGFVVLDVPATGSTSSPDARVISTALQAGFLAAASKAGAGFVKSGAQAFEPCGHPRCALSAGRELSADWVITGRLEPLGSGLVLLVQSHDVKHATLGPWKEAGAANVELLSNALPDALASLTSAIGKAHLSNLLRRGDDETSQPDRGIVQIGVKRQSVAHATLTVGDARGAPSAKLFQMALSSRLGAAKSCHRLILETLPNLAGQVELQFTVDTEGTTSDVSTLSNTTGSVRLAKCLETEVRAWKCPVPPLSRPRSVEVPILFAQDEAP